ncbi:MAG TPA: sulfotransferase [Bacteroidia bacterium]|nr:sulfotransferase [Bacteroidia bacterium]
MRIPDFFVVGSAKSGTTSLWQYLGQHPQIFMTDDISAKELGYYCYHYGIKELDKYTAYFKDAKPEQLVGESCHAYLSSPESAELIHKAQPGAKIIMLLRNPVDRAYSLYNWMAAHGYEPSKTFEQAIALEEKRVADPGFIDDNPQGFYMNYYYFRSGLYAEQIERYFRIFGREQCRVFIFEEIRGKWSEAAKDVFSFLGVDSSFNPVIEVHNESQRVWSSAWQFYFRYGLTDKLKAWGMSSGKATKLSARLMKMNVSDKKPIPLKKETRKILLDRYRDDIEKTARLLGKDLSLWLT